MQMQPNFQGNLLLIPDLYRSPLAFRYLFQVSMLRFLYMIILNIEGLHFGNKTFFFRKLEKQIKQYLLLYFSYQTRLLSLAQFSFLKLFQS